MKIVKIIMASVSVAILFASCQKNVEEIVPVQEKAQLTTITCAFPSMTDQNGTKVSLDATGKTGWEAGDKIVIYGKRNHADTDDDPLSDKVIHTLTASEVSDPSVAVFSVDLSGLTPDPAGNHPYNAVYPADESDDYLPFYSPWGASGRARFTDTNKHLLAGWIDSGIMTLKNVCAAIVFTVSGDFDTYYFSGFNQTETVGYGQYLVEFNNSDNVPEDEQYYKKPGEDWGCKNPLTTISGPVVSDGTTLNHIYFPNEVNLPNGFTITFAKSGKKLKTITSGKALTLSHDHMISLGLLPSEKMKDYSVFTPAQLASAYDLGGTSAGTANCYVVSEYGSTNDDKMFKFKAVRGNDASSSLDDAVSAEVLWETYNDASTVTAKTIIELVDYVAPYVYFKTPSSLHAGNAVIAVKNSEGTILWSWHIWAPETDYTYGTYGIASVNMMSRNLGALVDAGDGSVKAHGLHYQWGRKDPFVGQGNHGSSNFAKVAGVGKTNRDSAFTSEVELAANPTVFAAVKAGWYTGDFTAFWGADKTVFDPCPPGWKVPYKDDNQTKLFTSDITAISGWDYQPVADKYYAQIGSTKFPISGYIYYNGNLDGRENKFRVWSSKSRVNSSSVVVGSWLQIDNSSGTATVTRTDERAAYGCSVRCVAE